MNDPLPIPVQLHNAYHKGFLVGLLVGAATLFNMMGFIYVVAVR